MADDYEVRRAAADEAEAALHVIDTAFARDGRKWDCRRELPYLWNEDRVSDHWLCLREGRIVGVIGSYPFTVRLAGVDFRSAGVGQVSTLPEERGRGVMSRLLKAITAEMDDGRYDFTWLWGDPRRYGRFGWARGGVTYRFETFDKYLPEPPPASEVRELNPDEHAERIFDYTMAQPCTVHFTRREFGQLLGKPDLTRIGYRDAWAVFSPSKTCPTVLLADGPDDQVAALLAHLARQVRQDGDGWKVAFIAGPFDCALNRVARDCRWHMQVTPSANLRICDLAAYFEKACAAVQGSVPGGSDELSLRNSDNGQEVRIECRDGRLAVRREAGPDAHELSTLAISEAVFGLLPLETVLPGVRADSPLRVLLRMPVHVNHLFSL